MTDEIWKRAEIESPCVKICVVHPEAKICIGCYRSIAEIGGWSRMSAEERSLLMAELPQRAQTMTKRRGGRLGRGAV
jgi:uncharacterized protein